MNERSIAVHGLGYIGLVHAGALAALGWRVVGVDIDPGEVAAAHEFGVESPKRHARSVG